jgi:hypothetical protein
VCSVANGLQQSFLHFQLATIGWLNRRNTMAKSKRRVPKKITIKIPKALRKSKMFKSLLVTKLDTALLASALVSAAGAAAAVLARQKSRRKLAPVSAQPTKRDAVPIVRVGTPRSASDRLSETSPVQETSNPQHGSGEEVAGCEPQVVYPSESLTQAA